MRGGTYAENREKRRRGPYHMNRILVYQLERFKREDFLQIKHQGGCRKKKGPYRKPGL